MGGILDEFIAELDGFEWDAGNSDKNWLRHKVRQAEAEQVLLNRPLVLAVALKHVAESRFLAFGRTDAARQLAVVFTARANRVRVISARPLSRPERRIYAQAKARSESDSSV